MIIILCFFVIVCRTVNIADSLVSVNNDLLVEVRELISLITILGFTTILGLIGVQKVEEFVGSFLE